MPPLQKANTHSHGGWVGMKSEHRIARAHVGANSRGSRSGRLALAAVLSLLVLAALLNARAVYATGGLAIDGSAQASGIASSHSVSLTTRSSPDVIYLSVVIQATGATVSSVSDTAGLTWKTRASITTGDIPTYTWYAIAGSALSSDSITVTVSGTYYFTIIAFGISGADTSNPFDPNTAVPASNSGSFPTSPSVSISTTGTNDMIIGIVGAFNIASLTPGSGFTSIQTTSGQVPSSLAEYQIVSSAESGFAVDASGPTFSDPWTIIADAVVAPGAIPDLPSGVLILAIPILAVYILLRRKAGVKAQEPNSASEPVGGNAGAGRR